MGVKLTLPVIEHAQEFINNNSEFSRDENVGEGILFRFTKNGLVVDFYLDRCEISLINCEVVSIAYHGEVSEEVNRIVNTTEEEGFLDGTVLNQEVGDPPH